MNSNGYPYGGVGGEDGVTTDDVVSLDDTSKIELGGGVINFLAPSVQIAGVPIIDINSGVLNPMLADLDCNGFNLTDVGEINGANIGQLQTNIATLNTKTFYINTPLSLNGTIFDNNIYSDGFIKTGGTNQEYLMADGSSLKYSANSGNSNFYLYTSSQTITISPTSGEITYDNANQSLAAFIYISHTTRDNIDIEVYFKQLSTLNEVYIQDQNLSENFIQYNITGDPVITTNNKVAIPVQVRISGGTGALTFGPNHPVLISFFTNSVEADIRISALEGKTQHITANTSTNNINRSLNMLIQPADAVAIRSTDLLTNYAIWTPTGFNFYRGLNMNSQAITNAASISISSGTVNQFLKANGTLDSTDYATAASLSGYLPLTGGSLTGDITAPQFIKIGGLNTQFLKADGSSDGTNYASDLELANGLALKLNLTGGTLSGPLNMGAQNITNANSITATSITLGGLATSFLMANGSSNATTYLPTAGGTMTGAIDMGAQNIGNVDIITANQFRTPLGNSTDFLKADGSIDQNFYMSADSGYSATCVAYVNNLGQLTSNESNRWCQAGVDSLQTIINSVLSNTNVLVQLSSGTHGVTALIVDKANYSIAGSKTTPTQASTIINGAVQIGQAGVNTSLIKFSDIVFNTTLTIFSSATNQQTRHSFDNCVFQSTITFPTAVNGVTGYLYFTDCVFNQVAGITFNNITCSIIFTRCVFSNQVITNNSALNSIVFDSCRGLNSLSVTNALYRSVNILSGTSAGTLAAGSLSLSGAATSFIMGNGNLNTTKYAFTQAIGVSSVTNTGVTEVILNQVATIGSFSYADAQIGTCREWVFHGTITRATNATSTYTLRHKTNGAENMLLTMPASTNAAVTNLPFVLRFRVVRYTAAAISWSGAWMDAERNWSFYTTQNNTGGIVGLNVSAAYTITFQASNANTTILIHHVDIHTLYN